MGERCALQHCSESRWRILLKRLVACLLLLSLGWLAGGTVFSTPPHIFLFAQQKRVSDGDFAKRLHTYLRVARTSRVASTMLRSAAMVSGHLRVFRPQSGFTTTCDAGSSARKLCSFCTICSFGGTTGE